MPLPIGDHAVIGDLRTLALVALDGTVDYLCWPRFDSPSLFASLLDGTRGGAFELAPALELTRRQQLYLPGTNVLLTRFLSDHAVGEISDYMNVAGTASPQRLVRRVKAVHGTVRWRMRCAPRFDYARATHRVERVGDEGRCVVFVREGAAGTAAEAEGDAADAKRTDASAPATRTGPARLCLRAGTALEIDGDDAVAEFVLEHGASVWFVLDAEPETADVDEHDVSAGFKATSDWWREWCGRSTYTGRWRDTVNRSALALKLLCSAEHGSIVAAGTFGLPETPGGERNWDYRYTWIRDAAFTVYGFLRVGHVAEADAFIAWLDRVTRTLCEDGTLSVMYRVDGGCDLEEHTLDHLEGYRDSRPVRIGNGAAGQLQLDIYGELMDAIYLADKHGKTVSHDAWSCVRRMLDHVMSRWREPDEGIWEVRNGRQELLFSRLMCWVALDRGVRLATKRSLPTSLERWRSVRDEIHEEIHARFWNEEKGAFVQNAGGDALDASCLLMPLVRFIGPTDPRWLSTLEAVGRELTEDNLVYRYSAEAEDGLDGIEGAFTMCTFWYVECLARAGDTEQARFLFEKTLGYANHLGLYAEETGLGGQQLGNFPQAFTHLALISAAHYLDRAL